MDFQKVIYEIVEKKLKFYEVLFCTYCKGLFSLYKTIIMLIFFHICIK